MGRASAVMVGLLIGGHGLLGLFVEGRRLIGIFNVDIASDLIYLFLGAALLWVGSTRSSALALRSVHAITALVLVGVGLLGVADSTVYGLLPTGLELVDFLLLFGVAAVCIITALLPRIDEPLTNSGAPLN